MWLKRKSFARSGCLSSEEDFLMLFSKPHKASCLLIVLPVSIAMSLCRKILNLRNWVRLSLLRLLMISLLKRLKCLSLNFKNASMPLIIKRPWYMRKLISLALLRTLIRRNRESKRSLQTLSIFQKRLLPNIPLWIQMMITGRRKNLTISLSRFAGKRHIRNSIQP